MPTCEMCGGSGKTKDGKKCPKCNCHGGQINKKTNLEGNFLFLFYIYM
ncbi:hypothetical protein CLV36_1274 [Laceyella sediminis]|jgi:hypothetical protein|uniref:Uncharacterized protein n=1 Tax=Laceyella sediminis TaxID=573074 RepID=A0ABX5EJB9_9BACL|nr:hypothetical protein CLV36_1274 [Laceyella sediminis]